MHRGESEGNIEEIKVRGGQGRRGEGEKDHLYRYRRTHYNGGWTVRTQLFHIIVDQDLEPSKTRHVSACCKLYCGIGLSIGLEGGWGGGGTSFCRVF